MACSSCGRKSVKKVYTIPVRDIVVNSYIENQDGVTTFVYTGIQELRAKGCASGHIYLFSPKREYSIDKNDFSCFMQRWTSCFEEVLNGLESDYSKNESESPKDTTGISEGDGQIYSGSNEGFSEDGENLGEKA